MIGSYPANHVRYTEQSMWRFVWLPSLCHTDFWRNPWALACITNIWFASAGANIGFLVGGDVNPWVGGGGALTYKFAGFSEKLHEIKKILVRGGGDAPLDPPLRSNIFLISCSFWENLSNLYVGTPPHARVGVPSYGKSWICPWVVWKDTNKILHRNVCLQIVRKIWLKVCVVLRTLEFSLKIIVECLEVVLNMWSDGSRIFPRGVRQVPKLRLFLKFLPKTAWK